MIIYLLVQMGNAYDTTRFIGMLNNTTVSAKYLKSVLVLQQDMKNLE
jgi:hypothetical protein